MDPKDFMTLLDINAQVMRPPFEIIQGGVDRQWAFAMGHTPSETSSEADPPMRLSDVTDEIPIDGVLGQYNPSTQEITIFRKGIGHVAEILRVSPEDLTQVVRLHEWAHALLHLGLQDADRMSVLRDDSQWAELLARLSTWFNALDANLHESLAQLLTREGLRWLRHEATIPEAQAKIDRIEVVFKQLMRRAPSAYQIDEYDSAPKNRIIGSVRLLKNGGLVGADAWDTVVKW
jgi:hypothetical protein